MFWVCFYLFVIVLVLGSSIDEELTKGRKALEQIAGSLDKQYLLTKRIAKIDDRPTPPKPERWW